MKHFYKSCVPILFLILVYQHIFAEGTKELMPLASSHGYIQIFDRGRTFATYNALEAYRLHIHISDVQEKIYLGFNQPNNDVYFRLKDPNGNIVLGPNLISNSGQGYINSYSQAVAGPQQIIGASGYNAIEYQPTSIGDYYIEFNPTHPTNLPANTSNGSAQRIFDYFDITVAQQTNIKKGRLWSKAWDINSKAINHPIDATMYIYSTDSIVTAIDFNGMQPYGTLITANSSGVKNTGNIIEDRKSAIGDFSLPEYKIFLNNPDPIVYPSGFGFRLNTKSKITGCAKSNLTLTFNFNRPGLTEIILDLNQIEGYQNNSSDIKWTQTVGKGIHLITWDGKDGLGNLIPDAIKIPVIINYLDNATHLPLYDVEANPKGYQVSLIRPSGPAPKIYWDDSNINTGTAIDGLENASGCEQANGCHRWTGRGNNNCPSNCPETINTWWYPSYIVDTLDFKLPTTLVDADNRIQDKDTSICVTSLPYALSASTNGNQYTWSGGNGTFNNPLALLTTYLPTTDEIESGKSTLYLTSSLNSLCPSVIDSVIIHYTSLPQIIKSHPSSICINSDSVFIDIQFNNTKSYVLNNILGTYHIDSKRYHLSSNDRINNNIYFTIIAENGSICDQAYDTVRIHLNPLPIIQTLLDTAICKQSNYTLRAVSNGSSLEWYNINTPLEKHPNDYNITVLQDETYVVKSTSTEACSTFDTLNIYAYQLPSINIDLPPCFDHPIWIKASYNKIGLPTLFQTWYRENIAISTNVLSDSVYIQNTGAYSYKLYTQHCEVTQSFNIIGPSVINIKDTISTCTQSSVTPPTYSHTSNIWMNKNGDVINDTYTFQNDSYIFTTYTTIEGCTIKDSMLVLVIPKPNIITPDTLLCKGSTISYTPDILTTLPSTARFEWLYNGQPIGNQSQLIIQQAGPYTVEVINENCSVKNNFIVNEIPLPISLLESEKKICFTESVGLKLFAGTHATYNWQNGSSNEAYFTIQQPGTYFITITNIEGCSAKDSIKIVEACPPKLFVAEAYTPNGDGLNDVFKVNHEYITQFKMVVYNRWGEIIFISEDPNESWNGEYKNEQMPMGVYPYIITYESMFEEYKGPYKKTGSVTLIR